MNDDRMRVDTFPKLGVLQIMNTNPPTYHWHTKTGILEFSGVEELQDRKHFQRECMRVCQKMPIMPKREVWEQFLNLALKTAEIVEFDDEASDAGVIWEFIHTWIEKRKHYQQGREDILRGHPWTDDAGTAWFTYPALLNHLCMNKKPHKPLRLLLHKRARHQETHIGGRRVRLWGVTSDMFPWHDTAGHWSQDDLGLPRPGATGDPVLPAPN